MANARFADAEHVEATFLRHGSELLVFCPKQTTPSKKHPNRANPNPCRNFETTLPGHSRRAPRPW
eukprot:639656-Lingulodinium_polyedra.AAC.1